MTIALVILIAFVILFIVFWASTYHPPKIMNAPFECDKNVPVLKKGQEVKVLSWNVQYMAGKKYVFYYEVPEKMGTVKRASKDEILKTTKEVARVISAEDPDVVLLQEIDEGARRTDYEDQLEKLQSHLKKRYPCHATAWYWKSPFIPHPKIMGSVGMKLCVLSKYKINNAIRHQLPVRPADPVTKQFYLKRAILEVRLLVEGEKDFIVCDTHLEAFGQGTDILKQQVSFVDNFLKKKTEEGSEWLISGDYNLLPPGKIYDLLPKRRQKMYSNPTEIELLFNHYPSIPSFEEVNGDDYEKWLTHFHNDPTVTKPIELVDYIFHSKGMEVVDHYVRQKDTMEISDHFPVVAKFKLP